MQIVRVVSLSVSVRRLIDFIQIGTLDWIRTWVHHHTQGIKQEEAGWMWDPTSVTIITDGMRDDYPESIRAVRHEPAAKRRRS